MTTTDPATCTAAWPTWPQTADPTDSVLCPATWPAAAAQHPTYREHICTRTAGHRGDCECGCGATAKSEQMTPDPATAAPAAPGQPPEHTAGVDPDWCGYLVREAAQLLRGGGHPHLAEHVEMLERRHAAGNPEHLYGTAAPGQDDMRRERAILHWAADRAEASRVLSREQTVALLRRWADEMPTTTAPPGQLDLDAITNRAETALDWVRRGTDDGWLPLSVREHFETDTPALVAEVRRQASDRDQLEREAQLRTAEVDQLTEQLRQAPGWCLACPPGCTSCAGPDCECYDHQDLHPEMLQARLADMTANRDKVVARLHEVRAELEQLRAPGVYQLPAGAGRLILTYTDGSRRRMRVDGSQEEVSDAD